MKKKQPNRPFNILGVLIVFSQVITACGKINNLAASTPTDIKNEETVEITAQINSQDEPDVIAINIETEETQVPTNSEVITNPEHTTVETVKPEKTNIPLNGHIEIWHALQYKETVGLSKVIAKFTEENPNVEFRILYIPFSELRIKYETAVAEGSGPDLLIGVDDWGPPMYEAGLIADVSDVKVSEINEHALSIGNFKNVQIGLPYVMKGVVMYRNQRIFPEPASDFEDLQEKAVAATSTNIQGALLETSSFYSLGHLYGLGGALMTEEGDPAFNTPEGEKWLEMLQSFYDLGANPLNSGNDYSLFRTGNTGVIIDGTWNLGDLSAWLKNDLVIDPWPSGMSGFVQAGMIYLNPNSSGTSRDAAKSFIAFLLMADSQLIYYQSDPSFIPVNNTVNIEDQLRKQAQTAFASGVPWIVLPELGVYWGPIDNAIYLASLKKVDPQNILATAEQEILNALVEFRSR